MAARLLLVDSDESLLPLLQWSLEQHGFAVETAVDGRDVVTKAALNPPDLIVLELMLRGMHGFAVCRALRQDQRLQRVPVIVLTARHEPFFHAAAKDVGVADYLTKPFDLDHLLAQIRLRLASSTEDEDVVDCSALHLVHSRFELRYLERAVAVVPHEFAFIAFVMRHPNRLLKHSSLIHQVWGPHPDVKHGSLAGLIRQVRRKLATLQYPGHIAMIRGEGYRFEPAPPPLGKGPAADAKRAAAPRSAVSAVADGMSVASKQEPESLARPLRMDPLNRGAIIHGQCLSLTRREYALLERLSNEPGRVVSRETIARDVWQGICEPNANVIDVYVGRLRRKLRGAGYVGCLRSRKHLGFLLEPGRSGTAVSAEMAVGAAPTDLAKPAGSADR
jgi:DNA-binding response OmpR family regulator